MFLSWGNDSLMAAKSFIENYFTVFNISTRAPKTLEYVHIHSMGTRLNLVLDDLAAQSYQISNYKQCALISLLYYGEDLTYEDVINFLYDSGLTWLLPIMGLGVPCQAADHKKRRIGKTNKPTAPIFRGDSGEPITEEDASHTVYENVVMHDDPQVTLLSLAPSVEDYTYHSHDHMDDTITNWLSRPRNLYTYHWAIGGSTDSITSPYSDYFTASLPTPLQNKLNNYFLFRGKMRLTFKVNGSPFHYGRLYASFAPNNQDVSYPQFQNSNTAGTITNYNNGTSDYGNPWRTLYTQRPGVFIDPTTNEPVELELPFCFPNDYWDLRYGSVQGDFLGNLMITVINPLQHSNGATDPIDVKIQASIIDPVLSTPTNATVFQGDADNKGTKTIESKRTSSSKRPSNRQNNSRGDEYGNGIISAPATALAGFAGSLSSVPIIGKFATATKIAASAVSDVAKLFGMSRPVDLQPAMSMRPRPLGKMAVTDGDDTIPKLSVDSKQEVSIDPSTVGLNSIDQMAIPYIAQRESLLYQQNWDSTQLSGVRLCSIKVHPMVYPLCSSTDTGGHAVHFNTALAWVTRPFAHWRGSLVYRIQIVASQMHRGRLLVQWEPSLGTVDDVPNLQTRYSQILDLTECRDMSFCVAYNQAEPFRTTALDTDSGMVQQPSGPAFDVNSTAINGYLSFFVFNQLGAPISTSSVTINVYVRAGDDYMLQNPSDFLTNGVCYRASGDFVGNADHFTADADKSMDNDSADYLACDENMPYQREVVVINGTTEVGAEVNDLHKVFFGEQIVSLRQLLKRYTYCGLHKNLTSIASPGLCVNTIIHDYLPVGPGTTYGSSSPWTQDSLAIDFNFARFGNYIRYFMQPYACYRGGVRYKYLATGGLEGSYVFASRISSPSHNYTNELVNVGAAAKSASFMNYQLANVLPTSTLNSINGMEITCYHVNGHIIEFEVPWQASSRFQYAGDGELFINNNTAGFRPQGWMSHQLNFILNEPAASLPPTFMEFAAAGEDFSLFYFINAPLMYDFQGEVAI